MAGLLEAVAHATALVGGVAEAILHPLDDADVLLVDLIPERHQRVDVGLGVGAARDGVGVREEVRDLGGVSDAVGAREQQEDVVGHHVDRDVREEPDEARGLGVLSLDERDGRQTRPAAVLGVRRDRPCAEPDVLAGALPAVVVVHRRDLDQRGVHPRQVVVLHEVLADQLPVGLDVVLDAALQAVLAKAVAGEALGQIAELVLELGRLRVEADEDEEVPLGDAHGVEAHLVLVERLDVRHVEGDARLDGHLTLGGEQRRAEAFAVEVVRPRVVRAREETLDVARALAQAGAAVPAHVVVRTQFAVAVARDDQRAARNLDDEKVAGLAHLVGDADGHPAFGKELLLLELVEVLRGVGVGHQRPREIDGQAGLGVGVLPEEGLARQWAVHARDGTAGTCHWRAVFYRVRPRSSVTIKSAAAVRRARADQRGGRPSR